MGPVSPESIATVELQAASLGDVSLFDGRHLPFELAQFSSGLAISFHEESSRLEQYDCHAGCDGVVGALVFLHTGDLRSAC